MAQAQPLQVIDRAGRVHQEGPQTGVQFRLSGGGAVHGELPLVKDDGIHLGQVHHLFKLMVHVSQLCQSQDGAVLHLQIEQVRWQRPGQ